MKIGYFSPARGIYFRCVRCTCHSYTVLGGNESAQQPRKIHDKLPKTFVEIIFAFLRGFNVEMWQIRWILENSFRLKQKLILFFLGNYSFPFSTRDDDYDTKNEPIIIICLHNEHGKKLKTHYLLDLFDCSFFPTQFSVSQSSCNIRFSN